MFKYAFLALAVAQQSILKLVLLNAGVSAGMFCFCSRMKKHWTRESATSSETAFTAWRMHDAATIRLTNSPISAMRNNTNDRCRIALVILMSMVHFIRQTFGLAMFPITTGIGSGLIFHCYLVPLDAHFACSNSESFGIVRLGPSQCVAEWLGGNISY